MYLVEEYINRHQLNVEWVGHVDKVSMIFRSKNPMRFRWMIVHANLTGQNHHPYYYDVNFLIPKMNKEVSREREYAPSKPSSNGPFKIVKDKVNHDQFEYFIRSLMKKSLKKFNFLKTKEERELALWEMFVFTSDRNLAVLPFETKNSIARSVDPTASVADRYKSLMSVMDILETRYAKIYMPFQERFLIPYLNPLPEFTNLS